MARIGLVAGEGKLPIAFAKVAKAKGDTVIAFGLRGVTDEKLADHVAKMHWLDWGALQKGLLLLAMERIRHIVMLGKLKKELFFKDAASMDDETKSMLQKMGDKKDYALMNKAAAILSKVGVEVMDSTAYLRDLIPAKGVLTKRAPTEAEERDIDYGQSVAKALSGFDIGQTLIVKEKTVIAVEAMEGTDEVIQRAGRLVQGGFVAVKVARPDQDMRFDVPLVGIGTLKAIVEAGGSVVALEADKTLLMDRDEVIRLADERNIAIVVI